MSPPQRASSTVSAVIEWLEFLVAEALYHLWRLLDHLHLLPDWETAR